MIRQLEIYKKKPLNTNLHKGLNMSLINKYLVKTPEFFEMRNILRKTRFRLQ